MYSITYKTSLDLARRVYYQYLEDHPNMFKQDHEVITVMHIMKAIRRLLENEFDCQIILFKSGFFTDKNGFFTEEASEDPFIWTKILFKNEETKTLFILKYE